MYSSRAAMHLDAIVIGAGPAGATAARLLAAEGWRVALVEKENFPRRKVCGEFISTPTHAVLDACGVGAAFRELAGPPVSYIALFSGDTSVTAKRGRDWGRALGREHLDLLLRDAAVAAGAILFQPAEWTALERDGEDQVCILKAGGARTTIRAPIVIAATGSWRGKPPAAVDAPERPGDLFAFKAHFREAALALGLMPLLVFPGGYGGLVTTDGGRLSLSCCIRRDKLASLRRPGMRAGESVVAHIVATTLGARMALAGATPDGPVLAAGPIRPGIRPRWKDGVFTAGNLAGEAHPLIAEGISMAIQASHLLVRCLLIHRAGAGPAYEALWLRRFGPRLAAAGVFARAALALPGSFTSLVGAAPSLLTWGAGISGKRTQL